MTKEQHEEWEKYVRLMEHTWNTSTHSVLKCSPFEAAHGLPARSAIDSLVTEANSQQCVPFKETLPSKRAAKTSTRHTDLMTSDGISAMRDTARAFEKQIKNLRQEAAQRTAQQNRKGPKGKYKLGNEVSFYLPPSETQAKEMGRKPKHLLQYRGPAIITKVLSDSTYQIDHNGRTYYRCFSELRPYKSPILPLDLPMANDTDMQKHKLKIGNYVSLCDSDEPEDDHFHLCKVIAIRDDKAVLLNHGTWGKNIKTAVFKIMYQDEKSAQYTLDKPRTNVREQEVVDEIDLDVADDYIDHYDIKITNEQKIRIKAKSVRQLRQLGLKHHVLGDTFP